MKKFIWMFATVAALLLTSCLEDTGYSYTSSFTRIVTIDHSTTPIRFYCDYTNEVIECQNVNDDSDLGAFDLKNATRAIVNFYFETDYYESVVTLQSGTQIDVLDMWTSSLPTNKTYNPVYGFNRLQVESSWSYPYAWVSKGYLNIIPVTLADEATTPYLAPAGVNGDTLKFNLYMSYELGKNYRAEYSCFDLRQLTDTLSATPKFRPWMKEMTDLIQEKDSVMLCVWADYLEQDSVIKVTVPTDYFKFSLND